MKRGQRFLAIIALASLMATGGFGCKGLSATQVAATKPVSLELWTSYDDVDAIQTLVDKYKVLRPYLTVNIRQINPGDIYQRLIESLANDTPPDIISINSRSLGMFADKLAPMPATANDTTVLVEKTTLGTNTTVTTNPKRLPTAAQIDSAFVQSVGKGATWGGNIYGLPMSLDTMAIYYNKDLLDRSSVAEPPKTWEDFQIAVKKITKFDRGSGTVIQAGTALGLGNNVPNSDDLLYILFKQSNVDMVDRGGQAVFNYVPQNSRNQESPAATVVNFYTDFANPARDTYSWNESMPWGLDAFVSGKVGFLFGFSYYNSVIRARAPQLNYRILPLIQLDPEHPVNAANYSLLTVVAKSKHLDAAWALQNYLTYSDATKEYLDITKRPTAIRSYIAKQMDDPDLAPFVSQVLVAESWYRGRNYQAAAKAIVDMFHEWLEPAPDPNRPWLSEQAVLNRAASKINQTL